MVNIPTIRWAIAILAGFGLAHASDFPEVTAKITPDNAPEDLVLDFETRADGVTPTSGYEEIDREYMDSHCISRFQNFDSEDTSEGPIYRPHPVGNMRADVLIRNKDDGRWSMTMLNGTATVAAGLVDMTRNLDIEVLETADYNNDGRADLSMRHTSESYQTIRWVLYQLDGTTVLDGRQPGITKNPDWKPIVD